MSDMSFDADSSSNDGSGYTVHSYNKSKHYWATQEATVNGMLGGLGRLSNIDARSSIRLLNSYYEDREPKPGHGGGDDGPTARQTRTSLPDDEDNLFVNDDNPLQTLIKGKRALDCGAGIGRVTKTVLLRFFERVDLLEQNPAFLEESKRFLGDDTYANRIGHVYCCGLQEFEPLPNVKYDVIWAQWVTGYLTEEDFVAWLIKCKTMLTADGRIIIKDNHTQSDWEDTDMVDASITRARMQFIQVFKKAGCKLVLERKQAKFPRGLYPVSTFVLRPF